MAGVMNRSEPSAFMLRFFESSEPEIDIRDGVAVIDVSYFLGRWSIGRIRRQFDLALGNPSARAILLNVDSGGGSTSSGVFDLSDYIFEARGPKPIWAIANDAAFSAAYAIASAADQVHVTRTGGVGSVGVIAQHADFSMMDQRMGVTITTLIAGARKKDLIQDEPLSDKAAQLLQIEIDRIRELFAGIVARNRGIDVNAVMATEAGVFYGPHGQDADLADGVANFDEALAELQSLGNGSSSASSTRAHQPTATEGEPMSKENENKTAAKPEDQAAAGSAAAESAAKPDAAASSDAGASVTELDSARSEGSVAGRNAERARASAITTQCTLAGCPERAGEFIAAGKTPEEVGDILVAERSDGDQEIDGAQAKGGVSDDAELPEINSQAVMRRWNNPGALRSGAKGGQ